MTSWRSVKCLDRAKVVQCYQSLSRVRVRVPIILPIFWFNPYRQIPETISKKRAVTQGIFRKLFPGKFHEYLPMKKYFPISGKSFRKFSWVITRIYEISNFIQNHIKDLEKSFRKIS